MTTMFSNAQFTGPSSGNAQFLYVILYDSAPFECFLTQTDPKDTPGSCKLAPEENYSVPENPSAEGTCCVVTPVTYLVYRPRAFCRPLRILSAFAVDACNICIEVQEFRSGSLDGMPPDAINLNGLVDPEKLLDLNSKACRMRVATCTFEGHEAAGDFLYNSCIGYHIGVVSQVSGTTLIPARFSSTVNPFYRQTIFKYDPSGQNPNPGIGMYGNGWLPATTTAYPATSFPTMFENAPIVPRPVGATRDEQAVFRSMTNVLQHSTTRPVMGFQNKNNTKNTDIGFYTTPMIFSDPTH